MKNTLILGLSLNLFMLPVLAQENEGGYDELRYSDGTVREQYQGIYETYEEFNKSAIGQMLRDSKTAFSGDNMLDPLPRVIPAEEYDSVLKRGVEQRAQAITAFLADLYSGQRRFEAAGIFPQGVLQKIVDRALDFRYAGKVNPEDISFFYGPDIIRDKKGTWRVIEDNPGFIGGIGDLKLAQELTLQTYPQLKDRARLRSADLFYKNLVKRYKERAQKFGSNKVVLLLVPPFADNEDIRIKKLFRDLDVQVVSQNTNAELVVTDKEVLLYPERNRQGRPEKVGFVLTVGEHHDLDPMNEAANYRSILNSARWLVEEPSIAKTLSKERLDTLRKMLSEPRPNANKIYQYIQEIGWGYIITDDWKNLRSRSGIINAARKGIVGLSYSPGVDFIGDKQFYMYIEELIRFYKNEEPIIKNIPTRSFANKANGNLDQRLTEKIFSNIKKYVIKKVDGRGGDAVWVGPKVKTAELRKVRALVEADPGSYIVQEFTPLSEMNDKIVDVRVIADVYGQDIFVTDTPWGRGLPKSGNGKVNLSLTGREITVLVREGVRFRCEKSLLR